MVVLGPQAETFDGYIEKHMNNAEVCAKRATDYFARYNQLRNTDYRLATVQLDLSHRAHEEAMKCFLEVKRYSDFLGDRIQMRVKLCQYLLNETSVEKTAALFIGFVSGLEPF